MRAFLFALVCLTVVIGYLEAQATNFKRNGILRRRGNRNSRIIKKRKPDKYKIDKSRVDLYCTVGQNARKSKNGNFQLKSTVYSCR